jgi:hypothetical protein
VCALPSALLLLLLLSQLLVNDNLDLGCTIIERAATDKAVRDIDKSLAQVGGPTSPRCSGQQTTCDA